MAIVSTKNHISVLVFFSLIFALISSSSVLGQVDIQSEAYLLQTVPEQSVFSVRSSPGRGLRLDTSPSTFRLFDASTALKLNISAIVPGNRSVWLGTSDLFAQPDTIDVIVDGARANLGNGQFTLSRPEFLVLWGGIIPDSAGRFSLIPLEIQVAMDNINGTFQGRDFNITNVRGVVPSSQLPRVNGRLTTQDGGTVNLSARSQLRVPFSTIIRAAGLGAQYPNLIRQSRGGFIAVTVMLTAVGSSIPAAPAPAPSIYDSPFDDLY